MDAARQRACPTDCGSRHDVSSSDGGWRCEESEREEEKREQGKRGQGKGVRVVVRVVVMMMMMMMMMMMEEGGEEGGGRGGWEMRSSVRRERERRSGRELEK